MDILWRLALCVGLGGLAWLLHTGFDPYPQPLPPSKHPRREIIQALILYGLAALVTLWMTLSFEPWLRQSFQDETIQELLRSPVLTIVYIIIPLWVVRKRNRWTINDLGLTLRTRSRKVSWFAIGIGLLIGGVAYVTNQSNISIEPLPWGMLLLLVYNNTFVEELFHRGVIQSKLERAVGQNKAVLWGGILFGLTHIAFDISMLLNSQGAIAVLFALLAQTIAGWILCIIYMKTRNLWPGLACHYLGNWLPSILSGIFA